MKITSTYSVRLRNFNRVFDDTVEVYRHAVDYFIELFVGVFDDEGKHFCR